ncbi:amino acid adenylation domain-containing protein [Flavobacterium sp. 90]|uniref:non-ribosomal peptide synthetase n=1 Tax=unclassified Flavobacterium TaxID=196869 RepID=UPI000EAFBA9B|nr:MULTISPECIES: non-ribosomal peptide synthetase [unclassified Flavobacterium]RKR04570.1 amino acid adenylation domain-containing protein [Flavobacterium sp. 81]TCK55899.1 amino acid adenylation domain-containing protein [Flavobacterium sp. 90]
MKLTLPQQDIYFDQLLHPNEPIYNIGAKIEIKGQINIEIFNKAYIELINQHDAYRIIIGKVQENITSKIVTEHTSELGFIDFSQSKNPVEESILYMQKEFMKPFDLFDENLLHVFTLLKITDDHHYLFSVYHHIITDGWGTSLMFQRLVQNYNEILEFGEVRTVYSFSYKCFIEDDAAYQISESFAEDKKYWIQKFQSLPENLFTKIDDAIKINKSSRKELVIKRHVYNQLNSLASDYKCSTFNLILAVLYTYFGRKHQNNDFAIGLPVLNRGKSAYKKTVGLFMGISPLRIPLDFDSSIADLITDIKNQLRQDYRHQRFPLGKLIQELQAFNEKERLFNITLSYEKQNYATNFHNTQTRVIPLSHQSERVALAIYIREFDEDEDVKIDFDYNLNYFDDARITEVALHFENLIDVILNYPDKKLKDLIYLTKKEEHRVIVEFNSTKADYPKDKTILDLFTAQVEKNQEKVAVKDDQKSFSYAELNKLSNQIAEYLVASFGEDDKSPIAVLVGRSANLLPVLLGILKSGRSYIPLDPTFPKERLSYIVDNSQSKVVISEKEYELEKVENVAVVSLENILAEISAFEGNKSAVISPKNTAYIIYTSGSTGNPKGVEIGHQSLLNFLMSIQQEPGVCSNDILFSVTTSSFDISILEFFAPLISGATLYIANQDILSDPNFTILKIEEIQPTLIQATPSFYQMLFNADWQGNKELKVLCGGDLLSEALAEKLINNSLEVWNMYGPTETTIWSSIKKITNPKEASNIGKPINNTQFYILDSFLNPKPIGTSGAIYIAGDGLAKGYYKNDILTKEKFIKNPFNETSLLYETGDVGKWNDKGEIEFLGRNDNQVKIRGYRIELGDIEAQLNKIERIKDSVVIAKKGEQQEAFLVAYILKRAEVETEKIIATLKINLPYYMIPAVIIPLEEFPLTPNQKIDRKSLSQRNIQQNINYDDFKAPISDLEKKLSECWVEVLNSKEAISVNDNFFALGGHSLNAVKLIGLIAKHLSFTINLKTVFDYPTIELLASYLQELKPSQSNALSVSEFKDFYDLTPSQYSIWLASQQKNSSIAYNMAAGYSVDGIINLDKVKKSINKIISRHEILRTNFIEIGGASYQKINAFENVRLEISIHKLKSEKVGETISQLVNSEFDLETDLLIRVQLLQLETNQFILLFSTHHIIMDGLSLEIFIKEFIENYNESAFPDASNINTLKFQFKDYSEWFNKKVEDNAFKNEEFWKKYLQDYQPKNSFDKDFSIEGNQQRGSKYLFELTRNTTLALKELALKEQVTFYTVLMASLNVLIYKFSKHNDICIGTVSSGRNIQELNTQIGMFVNTLILRTKMGSKQTFIDLLKSTQNDLLQIDDYQIVPFEKVSQSIFDVMLVYQNPEFSFEDINELNDFNLISYPIDHKFSRMPVVFNLFESNNSLKGIIDYNSDLFEENTIQIIALKYCKILNEIIDNPFMTLGQIDDKLEFEKNKALDFDFNF